MRKCVIMKDTDLNDDKVADDINYLFNHGDLPLYYTKEEKLHIVRELEVENRDLESMDAASKYKI